MNERKFVFVAGLHRSGTTLLSNMLAAHPSASGFADTGAPMDEGQYLQSVYPAGTGWGSDAVGRLGFDPFAYFTERSRMVSEQNREKLFSEWSQHWDLSKPVLVEKSPPNIIRTRFLQAMFPNSYFITITRHPIATSIAVKKWCRRNPVIGIMMNWAVCHNRYRQDRRRLDRSLEVRYEDLVSSPLQELNRMADFIGIDRFSDLQMEVRRDVNEKYFAQWRQMTEGWRGDLVEAAGRAAMERSFSAFGYSFEDARA